MFSSDERRRQGIADARIVLAGREDAAECRRIVLDWYRVVAGETGEEDIAAHPATTSLVEQFRRRGMPQLVAAINRVAQPEGKMEPGSFLLALLLGQAVADDYSVGLAQREMRRCRFFGLEWYGAWRSFFAELTHIALHQVDVETGLWLELERQVAAARDDPGRHAMHSSRDAIRAAAKLYATRPDLRSLWQSHLDGVAMVEAPYLFAIAQSIDPQRMLSLASQLPHPALLAGCFDRSKAKDLPHLLTLAPLGVDETGKVQGEIMIVLSLLRLSEEECRRLAWTSGLDGEPLSADHADGLEPAASRLSAYVDELVAALRGRPDGIVLAWQWLEHLISEGDRFGIWRFPQTTRGRVMLDPLMTLISSVASMLEIREDAVQWIEDAGALWRVDRLCAVLAVQAYGKGQVEGTSAVDLLKLLTIISPQYPGVAEAMTEQRDVVSRVGAWHVLNASDPLLFVQQLWSGVRPLRERAWLRSAMKDDGNECGELVVLWTMAAMKMADSSMKPKLWIALKEILEDAMQTDHAAAGLSHWPGALYQLCLSFGSVRPAEAEATTDLLGDLLRPYLRGDRIFLEMVFALERSGASRSELSAATSRWNITPPELAARFLTMENSRVSRGYYNRPWLAKVTELAGATLPEIDNEPDQSTGA